MTESLNESALASKDMGAATLEIVDNPSQEEQTYLEALKQNPKVVFFSLGSCISSMLWGFDTGIYIKPSCLVLNSR